MVTLFLETFIWLYVLLLFTMKTTTMTVKEVLTSVMNLDDHDVMFVAKDGIGTLKAGKFQLRIKKGKPVMVHVETGSKKEFLPAPKAGKFFFVSKFCKENFNRPDFVISGAPLKGYENAPEGQRPAPLYS